MQAITKRLIEQLVKALTEAGLTTITNQDGEDVAVTAHVSDGRLIEFVIQNDGQLAGVTGIVNGVPNRLLLVGGHDYVILATLKHQIPWLIEQVTEPSEDRTIEP